MLNIGVFGAGHLGKIHLKLLSQSKQYNLIGFYDSNLSNAKKVSENFDYKFFESAENLISKCDVIDIVTPTPFHHKIAILALSNNCHVFIEKPITKSVKEAKELINLSKLNGLYGQVGHVERFNPAFIAAKSHITKPMFIETHRLAEFNPRGTDVPVVLDLMIHDIDIILSLVKSPIKSINASGVKVISNTPDIANARIEFENGCVVNLTTSRISLKKMRKMRIFQHHRYITIDFLNRIVDDYHLFDEEPLDDSNQTTYTIDGPRKKFIQYNNVEVDQADALSTELDHFIQTIHLDENTGYSGEEATKALKLAIKIQNIIESN